MCVSSHSLSHLFICDIKSRVLDWCLMRIICCGCEELDREQTSQVGSQSRAHTHTQTRTNQTTNLFSSYFLNLLFSKMKYFYFFVLYCIVAIALMLLVLRDCSHCSAYGLRVYILHSPQIECVVCVWDDLCAQRSKPRTHWQRGKGGQTLDKLRLVVSVEAQERQTSQIHSQY